MNKQKKLQRIARRNPFIVFNPPIYDNGNPGSQNDKNPVTARKGKGFIRARNVGVQEDMQIDEAGVLNQQQRRQRANQLRRRKVTMLRARKIARTKFASTEQLKRRAQKLALKKVRTRVAGQRGANYAQLSTASKISIDQMLQKSPIQRAIKRLAQRLIPVVRRSEGERLAHVRQKGKFKLVTPGNSHLMPADKRTDDDHHVKESIEAIETLALVIAEDRQEDIDSLLRHGLANYNDIPRTKQALKDPEAAAKYNHLREKLLTTYKRLLETILNNKQIYHRVRSDLLQKRREEQNEDVLTEMAKRPTKGISGVSKSIARMTKGSSVDHIDALARSLKGKTSHRSLVNALEKARKRAHADQQKKEKEESFNRWKKTVANREAQKRFRVKTKRIKKTTEYLEKQKKSGTTAHALRQTAADQKIATKPTDVLHKYVEKNKPTLNVDGSTISATRSKLAQKAHLELHRRLQTIQGSLKAHQDVLYAPSKTTFIDKPKTSFLSLPGFKKDTNVQLPGNQKQPVIKKPVKKPGNKFGWLKAIGRGLGKLVTVNGRPIGGDNAAHTPAQKTIKSPSKQPRQQVHIPTPVKHPTKPHEQPEEHEDLSYLDNAIRDAYRRRGR